jgi:cell division protein FtsA
MTVIPFQNPQSAKPTATVRSGPIACVDIGSSKITCLVGEAMPARGRSTDPRSLVEVHGFGCTAARGIKQGAIVDVMEAEKSIRLAVDAAERSSGRNLGDVYVGVSGGKPQSFCQSGRTVLDERALTQRNIDAAIADALRHVNIQNRSLLHVAPVAFSLDGVRTAVAPLGLHGRELCVELGLVTVDRNFLRNVSHAIERAHLHATGFVMSPYAAAHGVLVNDEMNLGTLLIEFGSAMTSVGYFSGGHLAAADSFGIGGELITSDIAVGLNTNMVHAERLKTLHGNVLAAAHDEQEQLPVPILGEANAVHHVAKGVLTAVIRPRVEEILEHVRAMIDEGPFAGSRTARVVCAGGGSGFPGLRELAAGILGRHTRIAEVPALQGLPERARQPAFSSAAGLLCYALSPDQQYVLPQDAVAQIERQQMGYVRRVGRWLADAF